MTNFQRVGVGAYVETNEWADRSWEKNKTSGEPPVNERYQLKRLFNMLETGYHCVNEDKIVTGSPERPVEITLLPTGDMFNIKAQDAKGAVHVPIRDIDTAYRAVNNLISM